MNSELRAAIVRGDDLREILKRCSSQEKLEFMILLKRIDLPSFNGMISLIDVNMHNDNNVTILHCMLGSEHFKERVQSLLQAGANLNVCIKGLEGTLLHTILANERFQSFDDILNSVTKYGLKIDFHLQDGEGKTPLMLAVKVMAGGAVKHILRLDPSCVDVSDNEGRTPLHIACALGQAWIVEQLLNAGANINARDHAGNTPAHYAVFNKNEVRQLLTSIYIDPKRDAHAPYNGVLYNDTSPIIMPITEETTALYHFTQFPTIEVLKGTDRGNILNNLKNADAVLEMLTSRKYNWSLKERMYVENNLNKLAGKSIAEDCMAGHLAVMKMLVRYGANITQANQAGERPVTHYQDLASKASLKFAKTKTNVGRLFQLHNNNTNDSSNRVDVGVSRLTRSTSF